MKGDQSGLSLWHFLHRLFQARNGVVFRVTDSNKNDYALKAVSLPVDTDQERKIHTLGQFNREKMWFGKTNTVQCAAIGELMWACP